jgi:hypothetical protein
MDNAQGQRAGRREKGALAGSVSGYWAKRPEERSRVGMAIPLGVSSGHRRTGD